MTSTQKPNSKYFAAFDTSEAALKRHFRSRKRRLAFGGATAREARAWQPRARKALAKRLGLDRFEACPPRAQKMGSARVERLTREEWRIQTERDVWMSFYIFIPDGIALPAPAVLCPHGHGSAGKWSTGGRWDVPAVKPSIEQYNYDYGLQIARAGFITVCPDSRGFGARREPSHQNDREDPMRLFASSCHNLALAGTPLGFTVQGMWTWDLQRLLDFVARDKRIDAARIGCAGLSGGGLQTLNLAALDDRIKAAVVSGYFYGVEEALLQRPDNCICNLVPGLWEDFDMGDIGALIAPRGLFVETGEQDALNGASNIKNVTSQVKIARRAFAAYGAGAHLKHHVFNGAHRWDGLQSIPWLQQQLQ